jgi:ABC-type Mn2+/Zn2+ transport system ATPase subunit
MAENAAATVRNVLAGFTAVPEEVRDYAADTAASLLEDMQDEDAQSIATEMQDALGPLLEGVDDSEIQALCEKIAFAFKGLSAEGESASGAPEVQEDFVVKCDNIILAYAGKSLLRSSSLRLVRGRRYGIVGQNGVGKTTLLTRIDTRDIANFPTDIKVVFVRHEILANDEQSVLEYMSAANVGCKTEAEVKQVLQDVGFTDALQKNSVLELSGGWRMKLALAGAILSSADLLLLDEPTNHLDVSSVAWLGEYLQQLRDTTVVIVSHDYDFLNTVITDVVHFVDHQLCYYPEGWSSFAEANPQVIRALPQKKNCSYFAKVLAQIRTPNPEPRTPNPEPRNPNPES